MCEREGEEESVCMWEGEGNRCSECAFVGMSVRGEEKERVECVSMAGLDHLARCSISGTV